MMTGTFLIIALQALLLGRRSAEERPTNREGGQQDRVSHLLERLADPKPRTRRAAARDLGTIGRASERVVAALADALEDSDTAVRRYSARSLGRIGPAARNALPALERARNDLRVCPCTVQGALERILRPVDGPAPVKDARGRGDSLPRKKAHS